MIRLGKVPTVRHMRGGKLSGSFEWGVEEVNLFLVTGDVSRENDVERYYPLAIHRT